MEVRNQRHTVLMIQSVQDIIHSCIWKARAFKYIQPFLRRAFACFGLNEIF